MATATTINLPKVGGGINPLSDPVLLPAEKLEQWMLIDLEGDLIADPDGDETYNGEYVTVRGVEIIDGAYPRVFITLDTPWDSVVGFHNDRGHGLVCPLGYQVKVVGFTTPIAELEGIDVDPITYAQTNAIDEGIKALGALDAIVEALSGRNGREEWVTNVLDRVVEIVEETGRKVPTLEDLLEADKRSFVVALTEAPVDMSLPWNRRTVERIMREKIEADKRSCVYEDSPNHSDDLIEVHSGRPTATFICGYHEQRFGIPQGAGPNQPAVHVHNFGPFEHTRLTGALIRRCDGCEIVSMDGDNFDALIEDEEDAETERAIDYLTNPTDELQRIYFDRDDEARDGLGWNVVDANTDSGIAARFATMLDAINWCKAEGVPYTLADDEPVTIVQVPVSFWVHVREGRFGGKFEVTKFELSPLESAAGYFGPGASLWDGPKIDLGDDGVFWDAVRVHLNDQGRKPGHAGNFIEVEWSE